MTARPRQAWAVIWCGQIGPTLPSYREAMRHVRKMRAAGVQSARVARVEIREIEG